VQVRKETQRAYTRFPNKVINKNKVKRGKLHIRHDKQVHCVTILWVQTSTYISITIHVINKYKTLCT